MGIWELGNWGLDVCGLGFASSVVLVGGGDLGVGSGEWGVCD